MTRGRISATWRSRKWRQEGGDFLGARVAIVRRSTFGGVGDVHVLATKPHRFDDAIEQLAGSPNERLPLQILVMPGGLTNEHQVRVRAADTKHNLRALLAQPAGSAAESLTLDLSEVEIVTGGPTEIVVASAHVGRGDRLEHMWELAC